MVYESQNLEFKSSWRDDWLKWICGFANAQGGVLEVGKNDDGEVIGLKDARQLLEDVPNKITSLMGIVADISVRTEGGLNYLVIAVQPYSNAISYHGKYYIRSGATNRELTGNALTEFLLGKEGRIWDSIPLPGVSFGDLDPVAFRDFRRKALSSARLTEADLDETPERFVRGAYVKIGRIDQDLLYYDEVFALLASMVDRVLDSIYLKFFHQAIHYEGIYRVETYPVPRRALREAITNAVLHNDFSYPDPIQISVCSDRITIFNQGRLPLGWTADDLPHVHRSSLRNPDLARVFFHSGQIEAWGRGIQRIEQACADENSPGPEYRTMGDTLETTFRYNLVWLSADPHGAVPYAGDRAHHDVHPDAHVGINVGTKVGITSVQQRILSRMIAEPTVTATSLAAAIGITQRWVESNIRALKDSGVVSRVGARLNGHWVVNTQVADD